MASFQSSYVPTTSAQVTRARDSLTLAVSSFNFSALVGILVLEGITAAGSGTLVFAQFDDGTEDERIRIERNASNEIHCIVTDGGVAQCDLNLGAVANSTAFKVAFAWKANDFAASLNGAAVVTDVSGTLPTVTTLRIGSGVTGNWGATIKKTKHLPRERASNAELQALAA